MKVSKNRQPYLCTRLRDCRWEVGEVSRLLGGWWLFKLSDCPISRPFVFVAWSIYSLGSRQTFPGWVARYIDQRRRYVAFRDKTRYDNQSTNDWLFIFATTPRQCVILTSESSTTPTAQDKNISCWPDKKVAHVTDLFHESSEEF